MSHKDWGKIKAEHALQEEFETETGFDEQEDKENKSEETGSAAPALDHASYRALEDKLTQAEQKAHENWEKLVRSVAEVENIRRRAERDIANAHRYSLEKFVNNLLPVADSLEQAITLAEKQGDMPLHEGLLLTMKLFLEALGKAEVKQIDPTGAVFDPQQHEAMSIQPSADVQPNTVLTVFQKGYVLNDRVIRPARVVVSK
jgi:molecular chaperone GrpE